LSRRQLVIGDLGHAKDLGGNSSSSLSNRTFGTANYLAPEAHDLKRTNKIDIWSFGCIVYELFNLEKLFNNRHPDRLRGSILKFEVETHLKIDKIKPLYVRVIKRYFKFLFKILKNLEHKKIFEKISHLRFNSQFS
jgi:serine/threonine protein kinase